MLYEFLIDHRAELIERCRQKAARRREGLAFTTPAADDAPLFLTQLVDTLRLEQSHAPPGSPDPLELAAYGDINRAAHQHGIELSQNGYPIDLLVHHYGDICQAVTELAMEHAAPISTNEFRILNRSLDDAIAEAVTAYSTRRHEQFNAQATAVGGHLDQLAHAQAGILDTAIQTFTALQTGQLGLNGATATAHLQSLHALNVVTQRSISDIRLASAKGTVTAMPAKSGERKVPAAWVHQDRESS